VFWDAHSPVDPAFSRQYRSAVFVAGDEQRTFAEASKAIAEARLGVKVHTAIEPLSRFHLAEAYHQKYYLRGHSALVREFAAMYPSEEGLVASTAAARVNGFVSGYGTPGLLAEEIGSYGLTPGGRAEVERAARRHGGRFRCGT
jgi:peptide-methionine (S)-S-oxide reductase